MLRILKERQFIGDRSAACGAADDSNPEGASWAEAAGACGASGGMAPVGGSADSTVDVASAGESPTEEAAGLPQAARADRSAVMAISMAKRFFHVFILNSSVAFLIRAAYGLRI